MFRTRPKQLRSETGPIGNVPKQSKNSSFAAAPDLKSSPARSLVAHGRLRRHRRSCTQLSSEQFGPSLKQFVRPLARGVPELYANRFELVPFRNVTVFGLVWNTSEHYGTVRNVSVRSLVVYSGKSVLSKGPQVRTPSGNTRSEHAALGELTRE